MKLKCMAIGMMALGLMGAAQAQDMKMTRWLAGAGITFGGDQLVNVPFTNGSSQNIKAGGGAHFYGGFEVPLNNQWAVQATLGYHSDSTNAANGDVSFTRYPMDVMALYSITPSVRIGAGLQYVNSAKLTSSGVVGSNHVSFKGDTGVAVEAEYLLSKKFGVKLRHVTHTYRVENSGVKFNGDETGIYGQFYF
jgi:hypothetical protein